MSIGIASLPNQRYRSSCARGLRLNIIICGGRGSGKRSLIHTLFGADLLAPVKKTTLNEKTKQESDSGKKSPQKPSKENIQKNSIEKDQENDDKDKNLESNQTIISDVREVRDIRTWEILNSEPSPDALCSVRCVTAHFKDARFNVQTEVVSVDGVGDCINNEGVWEVLKNIIESRNEQYEAAKKHSASPADVRIHAAIVLIENQDLSALDKKILKTLEHKTVILPVKARSDALTDSEANTFFTACRNALDSFTLCDPRFNILSACLDNAPFLVSSAPNGSKKLLFGEFSIESDAFKDGHTLKSILVDHHLLDLGEAANISHKHYMAEKLAKVEHQSPEEQELIAEFTAKMKIEEEKIEKTKSELLARKKMLEKELFRLKKKNTFEDFESLSIDASTNENIEEFSQRENLIEPPLHENIAQNASIGNTVERMD